MAKIRKKILLVFAYSLTLVSKLIEPPWPSLRTPYLAYKGLRLQRDDRNKWPFFIYMHEIRLFKRFPKHISGL
jgi:hypothetical protein